jgi:hypothetical protein
VSDVQPSDSGGGRRTSCRPVSSGRPVLVAAIAVLAAHFLLFGNYISDDAAITFAYARTLGHGHGLALTVGTDPVEGYSSFLWLLLVLPFCVGGGDPTWGVKALCFALGCGSFVLLAKAGDAMFGRATRHDAAIRDGGFVALAAFTPFVAWLAAGMENALYCALLAAALYCYVTDRLTSAAIALAALALTRVEGLAFAGVFVVHRLYLSAFRRRPLSRRDAVALATLVALYGTYQLWHWNHFLAFYPNSYVSKAPTLDLADALHQSIDFNSAGWTYIRRDLWQPYHLFAVVPFVILVATAAPAPSALILLMLLGVGLAPVIASGGDFYPEFRLGTIVLPLIFMLLAEGSRIALRSRRLRRLAAIGVAFAVGLVCYPSAAHSRAFGRPTGFHELRRRSDLYLEIARRVGEPRLTVVESDIGNVAYVTGFAIIDLGGLANLDIARFGRYFFLTYTFDEVRPGIIHVGGTWAMQANIPFDLMQRDYVAIEGGRSPAGYAEGTFLRRDLAGRAMDDARAGIAEERRRGPELIRDVWNALDGQPRESTPELFKRFARYCDVLGGECGDRRTVSRRAEAIADRYERQFLFAEAFGWYAAALCADPLNVRALRMREEMRLAAVGAGPLLQRGRIAEARAFYERLFARGWRPRTPAERVAVEDAVRVAHLRIPVTAR